MEECCVCAWKKAVKTLPLSFKDIYNQELACCVMKSRGFVAVFIKKPFPQNLMLIFQKCKLEENGMTSTFFKRKRRTFMSPSGNK